MLYRADSGDLGPFGDKGHPNRQRGKDMPQFGRIILKVTVAVIGIIKWPPWPAPSARIIINTYGDLAVVSDPAIRSNYRLPDGERSKGDEACAGAHSVAVFPYTNQGRPSWSPLRILWISRLNWEDVNPGPAMSDCTRRREGYIPWASSPVTTRLNSMQYAACLCATSPALLAAYRFRSRR